MLNKKEKCIFYLIVIIALIITAYLYHTRKTITDKKIMGSSLMGQKKTILFENFSNKIPIIIYYHIAEIGEWEYIVKEQLDLIKSSGLYDICQEIRIGFLGNKYNIMKFIKDKVKLVYHSTNIEEYEYPTINSLLSFSKKCKQEHYILYIHNKGSTGRICNNINGQFYWRQLMNYWLIEQYQTCINYLNKSYLTCGINVSKDYSHYSGNFWWSTTKYIKKLSPIFDINNRMLAEYWLLKKKVKN